MYFVLDVNKIKLDFIFHLRSGDQKYRLTNGTNKWDVRSMKKALLNIICIILKIPAYENEIVRRQVHFNLFERKSYQLIIIQMHIYTYLLVVEKRLF